MINKYFYIILILFFNLNLSAQQKWTLEKCIDYTLTHHPDIQTTKSKINLDDATIFQHKLDYLPNLSVNANQGFNLGNTYNVSTGVGQRESSFTGMSLNAGVDIFQGLVKHYRLKISQIEKQSNEAKLQQISFELRRQITELFLSAALDYALLQQLKEEKETYAALKDITQQLVDKQLKPLSDLYQIQTETQNIDIQIIQTEKKYKNDIAKLTTLMNYKGNIELEFNTPNKLTDNNLSVFNPQHYPEIVSLKKNMAAQQYRLKMAKSNLFPKLALSYAFHSNYYHILGEPDLIYNQNTGQFQENGFWTQMKNNRLHYVGLSINIPIFDNYKKRLQIKEQRKNLSDLEQKLNYKINQIRKLYEQITNEVSVSRKKSKVLQSNLKLYQKQVAIADKKWQQSLINVYDYLQIKRQLLKSKLRYLQEKYTYQYKQLILTEMLKFSK